MDKLRIEMWNTLKINGGYYGLLINFTNVIYQFGAIVKPHSETHLVVNIAYTAMTMTSILLYLLSYYKKNTVYIFPAFAIVAVRNVIRMIDLEGTTSHIT